MVSRIEELLLTENTTNFSETLSQRGFPALHGGWLQLRYHWAMIDLASTGKIVQFVRQAKEIRGGLPIAALYLNAVKDNTILLREATEALQSSIIPLLNTTIPDRQCVKDAPGQGSTVFRMKGEAAKAVAYAYTKILTEALKLFESES